MLMIPRLASWRSGVLNAVLASALVVFCGLSAAQPICA